MKTVVLQNWWHLVFRGVVGILFGIAALAFPWAAVTMLVLLFGAYAMVDGLFAIMYGLSVSSKSRVWMLLLEGTLGVLVGILAFLWPDLTALMLLYLIAAWAVLTGILEIAAMAWFRRLGFDGLLLAASGVISVALGVALFFSPQPGMAVLVGLLGGYGLVFGGLLIWLGLGLRRLHRTQQGAAPPSARVFIHDDGYVLKS